MSLRILLALLCSFILLVDGHVLAQSRDETSSARKLQWERVTDATNKGLPKTAIQELSKIVDRATASGRDAEAIRAIQMRIALQTSIEGNKATEGIQRLEKEIESARDSMKPTMKVLLANWYWNHFQQNRWRYQQRTQASGELGDDIETWDLPRILDKIDEVFTDALSDAEPLKKITVDQYDELLEKGNVSDAYRPTLFDVLARNAIAFYSAGEHAASLSLNHFQPAAESPLLSNTEDFLAWQPQGPVKRQAGRAFSPTLQAIRLYQELIRFHINDSDVTALADADLARVVFANAKSVGSDKQDRYRAALGRLVKRYRTSEVSALAQYELAQSYRLDEDLVRAHEIATQAVIDFPDCVGARRCRNLIGQVEAQSLSVRAERVWQSRLPVEVNVDYRNLTKVHFRLIPFDSEEFLASNRYQPEALDNRAQEDLLNRKPIKAWSVTLKETEDYQQRTQKIDVPKGVPKGSYLLISCSDKSFRKEQNQLAVSEVWVSDLSLIVRVQPDKSLFEGFVLDSDSGNPISNALVDYWVTQRDGRRTRGGTVRTDVEGIFRIRANSRMNVIVVARYRQDSLASSRMFSYYPTRKRPAVTQTRFFTDRAIYRPGQTIQYKGICYRYDQRLDQYGVLAEKKVVVGLFDPNNQEVERAELRSNVFGSFSGSFTAPADRLTGQMTVRVLEGARGQTAVRVEQYKRPQFKTELASPQKAAVLNGTVELIGTASAYSGAPIDDATVSWRVVRDVQYPGWWYWRCWWMPVQSSSQEIAFGEVDVSSDGTFEIAFDARPDLSAPVESEPTFRYTVYADVTDATGETRSSSRTVSVGYTALSASVSTDQWLTNIEPVSLRMTTQTLDGVGQAASGAVAIHRVLQPKSVVRRSLMPVRYNRSDATAPDEPDPSKPQSWKLGEVVKTTEFVTDAGGNVSIEVDGLNAGIYRAMLETKDRFGKKVTAQTQFQVFDPAANRMPDKLADVFVVQTKSVQPGDEFKALYGTGYDKARVFVEVEHRGKTIQQYWTRPGQTQVLIKQPINEAMRGGLLLRTTMVRENRAYQHTHRISVPWTNKQLDVTWDHFVSKLEPGSKETWSATITGTHAQKFASEMAATLYDASLDAYQSHRWGSRFSVFRQENSRMSSHFANTAKSLRQIHQGWRFGNEDATLTYRRLPLQVTRLGGRFGLQRRGRSSTLSFNASAAPMAMGMAMDDAFGAEGAVASAMGGDAEDRSLSLEQTESKSRDAAAPDLSKVAIRRNLDETAFFFPHLTADESGRVKLEFTMPEALTQWNFIAFAHDRELRSGLLTDTTVTQKDIMVQPNPPRFVRDGDELEFTVKVSNLSPTRQNGTVRLSFLNARTEEAVDHKIENVETDKLFGIPANSSETFSWRIKIPKGTDWMIYRAVASTGRISDGQQDYLPVISSRVLVTESMPLPVRDAGTEQFDFAALRESAESKTLEHQSLTVQMASNPTWYAVMALPYLMEDPYQCNEQTFNRLYANSLASHIAGSDPAIERIFQQWRGTDALKSPLEKNEDLKSVMLQETPWLRDGKDESAARQNVGVLFDTNRLASEQRRLSKRLFDSQLPSGGWSWFPGGRANEFMTLYLTTGFGRLRHLGVDVDTAAAVKALTYLDQKMTKRYNKIVVGTRGQNHLTPHVALYLYARSYLMNDLAISENDRTAFDYWQSQAKTYWVQLGHRQSQAHLAIALNRLGDRATAEAIMASIKERSVSDAEWGMFWRDTERSWWWYRAPIETQAMMIEAFDEVMDDVQAVKDCQVWLLKQKQTRDWKTTKATADAVYALLLRGTDGLRSNQLVTVQLAGQTVQPDTVEAGTGFYEKRMLGGDVSAPLSQVAVTKRDEGVAWGSVHWQYLEEVGSVKSHVAGPLALTKQYFIKENTNEGPTLQPVDQPVAVGDELVCRIILKSDRDMEYVHLKDHRGSGTEPVDVLSRYRYQDGLAYYESTQDTATHFFIDYLPKGTYVFEYSVRVQHRGNYETGLANIQCMYAPEFNSHSESVGLQVR